MSLDDKLGESPPDADGSRASRLTAQLSVAINLLSESKARSALAVLGVTVAVILVTMMTGLGYGMTQAGGDALTYIDQDLWATAGPIQLAPGTVGGIQNTLVDTHETQRGIEQRPDVQSAEAMAFQSVYVSADREEYDTIVGVGVTGNGSGVGLSNGFSQGDVHYANGSYDGPMTQTVILNNELAAQLNVTTGDTIYLGGTLATARDQEFTVVGINRRFSVFLGAPTAVVHLGELQAVTGTSGADRASMIGIRTTADANPEATAAAIEQDYPDLRVRTQQQQFQAVFENQGAIIASATTLVVVALLTGIGLVGNTLGLVVYQQRREFAAIRALGLRSRTLIGIITAQGLVLSVVGVAIGIAVSIPFADSINQLVESIVGFPNLIKLPLWIFGTGLAVGLGIGVAGATIAGIRLTRINPEVYLD